MQQRAFRPIYSHGGNGANGTVTGVGKTISCLGAIQPAAFEVQCVGGTATVYVESSGGAIDSTGNPPANSWKDMTDGGLSLTDGDNQIFSAPVQRSPFWRTRISAIAGATITSYIPVMIVSNPAGYPTQVQPSYPSITNVQDPSS